MPDHFRFNQSNIFPSLAKLTAKHYHIGMEYTLQWYWEGERDQQIAPFLRPLTLKLPIEMMRDKAIQIAAHDQFAPIHSFTISAIDGSTSERWFRVDGKWRRKDA